MGSHESAGKGIDTMGWRHVDGEVYHATEIK
jgi:hypothetical protein